MKAFHIETVEIGAQSLVDEVLAASRRGHSAADVTRAVKILKTAGLAVGLHLMVGLPGDSRARFAATVQAAVALAPDMVRIHPTLVFRDTPLAEAFYRGAYVPLTLDEAVESCKHAVKCFALAGIPIIRLGLQTTREMEEPGAIVAGPFHPAFGALVEASAFLDQASAMIRDMDLRDQWVTFHVPFRKESAFRGERNGNIRILTERFHLAGIKVKRDEIFHVSTKAIRS
jgi:histone acetyltransferase (RNA polymerase elongator complex component)